MTTSSIKIMQLSTYALRNLLFHFVATFDSGLLKAALKVLNNNADQHWNLYCSSIDLIAQLLPYGFHIGGQNLLIKSLQQSGETHLLTLPHSRT